jgi:hypothetical protein
MLASLAAGIYLGSVWLPVYFLHYTEVKAVVRDYGNQAVKNPDDATLVKNMCDKLRSLAVVDALGEDGRIEQRAAVVVEPQDVVWERDTQVSPPMLRVAFSYKRDVHYPIFDKWVEKTLVIDLPMDISRPNWGPTR